MRFPLIYTLYSFLKALNLVLYNQDVLFIMMSTAKKASMAIALASNPFLLGKKKKTVASVIGKSHKMFLRRLPVAAPPSIEKMNSTAKIRH